MSKILAIRFSKIENVAMTLPVVYSFAMQYPQHRITVLSNRAFAPFFEKMPENVSFYGVDLKEEHSGWLGLRWLYNDIKKEHFDAVADFHDVFRSRYLCWRLKLAGIKTAHIDRGVKGRKQLIRAKHKVLECQKSSFERFANVLQVLGYPVTLNFVSIFGTEKRDIACMKPLTGEKGDDKWIGIAPFAPKVGKIYPLFKQENVIKLLSGRMNTKIFLFGGGEKEIAVLNKWEHRYPNVISTAGKLTLDNELVLMSHLDVMLTMDSANMHVASLVNIPVVSIWGATHPYAGFAGWNQSPEHIIQADLPCRPCSLHGEKPCLRKDYACLQEITPEMVVERIENIIDLKN
ncbi:glycosyltransferase family 9 protein [Phocaeicola sp.]